MSKRSISTDNAPQAIGPYSQAVRAGHLLFLSGQIALNPSTGEMVSGGAEDQTRRVMENLKGVLEAAGLGFADVVKTTIYLQDLADYGSVNEVYGQYFDGDYPARAAFQVAGLPKGALVEIEAVAYAGDE